MNNLFFSLYGTISLLLQVPSGNSSLSGFEVGEYILVAIIIALQLWFFNQTRVTIQRFKESLPDVDQFSLTDATVLSSDLKDVPPQQLVDNLANYTQRAQATAPDPEAVRYERINMYMVKYGQSFDAAYESVQKEETDNEPVPAAPVSPKTALTILTVTDSEQGPVLIKIRQAINTYLIRNKGAIANFNLLRDIVQRNLDTVEEEIAVTTPIPVYLGLVGTMLGIIIGLFSLPDLGSESFIQGNGIANLLGGVKIAMIASAVGLVLTIYTNGISFRGAKSHVESQKNDLFTFLQTELLPVLSESVNAGVTSLNRSLDRFGIRFSEGIEQLSGLVQKNYDSMRAQQSALDALQKIDVSKVATFNIKVLGELKQSMDALERLAFGLKNVDTFVLNSRALVERSQDIVGLTDKIGQVLDYTKELQFYLNGHFQDLEKRGDLITGTVTRLDDVITREIEGLEKNIHQRIQAVGEIKITEDAWMQQAMRENQTALSKLRLLEPLQVSLNDFIKENTTAQRSLATTMQNVAKKSSETNEILASMLAEQQNRGLGNQIKRMFGGSNSVAKIATDKLKAKQVVNTTREYTNTSAEPPVGSSTFPFVGQTFFLSTPVPTSDGLCTFLDQRKSQFDPTSSLYRFELLNNNENQAHFQFESTSGTVSGALAYPDTYLHPACDYSGLDVKATRIETTRPGKAIRQGNVWKVTDKARIKFV